MFTPSPMPADRDSAYRTLLEQAEALIGSERNRTANAANLAALLFHALPDVNWAGFYWRSGDELVLGPFQGMPACVRIRIGQGVCGTAAEQRRSVIVQDVDAFAGHIACDAASRSEIVVPLIRNGELLGVLDIDSPSLARFDDADRRGLEAIAAAFLERSD